MWPPPPPQMPPQLKRKCIRSLGTQNIYASQGTYIKESTNQLGHFVLDGVALLPGDGDAHLLQSLQALLLRHLCSEGLLHSLALLPVDSLALLVGHGHTLLPEQKQKVSEDI